MSDWHYEKLDHNCPKCGRPLSMECNDGRAQPYYVVLCENTACVGLPNHAVGPTREAALELAGLDGSGELG